MLNKLFMIPVSGASNSFLIMTNTVCKCLTAKIVYQSLKRNAFRQESSIRQLKQTNITY